MKTKTKAQKRTPGLKKHSYNFLPIVETRFDSDSQALALTGMFYCADTTMVWAWFQGSNKCDLPHLTAAEIFHQLQMCAIISSESFIWSQPVFHSVAMV